MGNVFRVVSSMRAVGAAAAAPLSDSDFSANIASGRFIRAAALAAVNVPTHLDGGTAVSARGFIRLTPGGPEIELVPPRDNLAALTNVTYGGTTAYADPTQVYAYLLPQRQQQQQQQGAAAAAAPVRLLPRPRAHILADFVALPDKYFTYIGLNKAVLTLDAAQRTLVFNAGLGDFLMRDGLKLWWWFTTRAVPPTAAAKVRSSHTSALPHPAHPVAQQLSAYALLTAPVAPASLKLVLGAEIVHIAPGADCAAMLKAHHDRGYAGMGVKPPKQTQRRERDEHEQEQQDEQEQDEEDQQEEQQQEQDAATPFVARLDAGLVGDGANQTPAEQQQQQHQQQHQQQQRHGLPPPPPAGAQTGGAHHGSPTPAPAPAPARPATAGEGSSTRASARAEDAAEPAATGGGGGGGDGGDGGGNVVDGEHRNVVIDDAEGSAGCAA
jgi:hypothetical protein